MLPPKGNNAEIILDDAAGSGRLGEWVFIKEIIHWNFFDG
jgi:hypothetical protein